MKWIDAKKNNPPCDGYYIVRLIVYDNSNDYAYDGCHFENGEWMFVGDLAHWEVPGNYEITHFIIADEVKDKLINCHEHKSDGQKWRRFEIEEEPWLLCVNCDKFYRE